MTDCDCNNIPGACECRAIDRIAVLEDRIEDLGDEKNRLTAQLDRYKAAIEEGFYCQICGAANFASIDEEV